MSPGYYDTQYTRMSELLTAENERVTVEQIENIEGRAAHVPVHADGEPRIAYFLQDAKAAGFHIYNNRGSNSGPMTEEQKAERRTLIANNKAWASVMLTELRGRLRLVSRRRSQYGPDASGAD